jgi:hypothetical protein
LLPWKPRIPRLCHSRAKNIEAADVLRLPRDFTEFFVKPLGIAPRQLRYAADPEHFKVANHGRPYGNQVLNPTLLSGHVKSSLTR